MSFSSPGQPGNHEMARARASEHEANLAQAQAKAELNARLHDSDGDAPTPAGPMRRALDRVRAAFGSR